MFLSTFIVTLVNSSLFQMQPIPYKKILAYIFPAAMKKMENSRGGSVHYTLREIELTEGRRAQFADHSRPSVQTRAVFACMHRLEIIPPCIVAEAKVS